MLAGTIVVRLRRHAARADHSLKGILSPGLLGAFVLLGLFPLVAKRIVDGLKARKVYAKWTRPARFDRNVVVIGAGSAGLVVVLHRRGGEGEGDARREAQRMGGDCLNTGCVPSKALIRSAKLLSHDHAREGVRHPLGERRTSISPR